MTIYQILENTGCNLSIRPENEVYSVHQIRNKSWEGEKWSAFLWRCSGRHTRLGEGFSPSEAVTNLVKNYKRLGGLSD